MATPGSISLRLSTSRPGHPGSTCYNLSVFQAARSVLTSRDQLVVRAVTFMLAAVLLIIGLWGATHANERDHSAPISTTTSSSAVTAGNVEAPTVLASGDIETERSAGLSTALDVVTCIIGIFCVLALAALHYFVSRLRLARSRRQRPLPSPITAYSSFDHRGRHRFGIHQMSLLRV